MKLTILTLLAGALLTLGLLASCRGKVTISGDNGTDTLEFNTDSIREININVKTNDATSENSVSDEEAIAFIEEFYVKDKDNSCDFSEKRLKQYLSPELVQRLRDDFCFGDDDAWAEDEKYATWELLYTDPVGDIDLYDISKAQPTGDGRYEKRFTTAYWGTPKNKEVSSLYYTVERIDGVLKITKVEDEI
jgi:hypothetical protein